MVGVPRHTLFGPVSLGKSAPDHGYTTKLNAQHKEACRQDCESSGARHAYIRAWKQGPPTTYLEERKVYQLSRSKTFACIQDGRVSTLQQRHGRFENSLNSRGPPRRSPLPPLPHLQPRSGSGAAPAGSSEATEAGEPGRLEDGLCLYVSVDAYTYTYTYLYIYVCMYLDTHGNMI